MPLARWLNYWRRGCNQLEMSCHCIKSELGNFTFISTRQNSLVFPGGALLAVHFLINAVPETMGCIICWVSNNFVSPPVLIFMRKVSASPLVMIFMRKVSKFDGGSYGESVSSIILSKANFWIAVPNDGSRCGSKLVVAVKLILVLGKACSHSFDSSMDPEKQCLLTGVIGWMIDIVSDLHIIADHPVAKYSPCMYDNWKR